MRYLKYFGIGLLFAGAVIGAIFGIRALFYLVASSPTASMIVAVSFTVTVGVIFLVKIGELIHSFFYFEEYLERQYKKEDK